ncbi:hypothetical protein PORY_002154 [Pneumocystis oryctolagi]|uniref:Uncharacterized protein n=1 Tax=Pneumocystis oryctolagi TaxID=42067 RepID=A0ACB7CH42_9ASCO|nr:hypothetical protein PORY_002154 [Pneumocystis oryctolagi]
MKMNKLLLHGSSLLRWSQWLGLCLVVTRSQELHLQVSFCSWYLTMKLAYKEGIILLDCSGKWRTDRLEEIMCEKVKKIFQSIQENSIFDKEEIDKEIKEIVKKSLSCLYIFRPQNSTSLIATLQYLFHYFKSFANNIRIRYVFIDSISAFYWQDRHLCISFEEKMNTIYKRITELLKEFCSKWCSLAICTAWVIHTPKDFNPYTTDIRTFTISDDSLQIYHHHLPLSSCYLYSLDIRTFTISDDSLQIYHHHLPLSNT